ncbi:MAG: hypothetical protein ACI8PZ_006440 [Myxococcota bacterium]|jgi:hypothetical protein
MSGLMVTVLGVLACSRVSPPSEPAPTPTAEVAPAPPPPADPHAVCDHGIGLGIVKPEQRDGCVLDLQLRQRADPADFEVTAACVLAAGDQATVQACLAP